MNKNNVILMILMGITAVLTGVTGIIFNQSILNIIPLFVSLVIIFLQTKVSRWALLLGGINSILYTVVFFLLGLYAMAIASFCVAFPMQIAAFAKWSKNTYGQSTVLKALTTKQRIFGLIGFVLCWLLMYVIFSALGSSYLVWDNTISLIGIVAYVMTIFAFKEYTWLTVLTNACSIILYIDMMPENPQQITYLICSIYGTICSILAVIKSNSLHSEQKTIKM